MLKTKKSEITINKTPEEIKKALMGSITGYDSRLIFKLAYEQMEGFQGSKELNSESVYYKAMTVMEFDKGILLLNSLPELYRAFALDFSKNLQNDYKCVTEAEKSLAEIVALNFTRALYIQDRLTSYLAMKTIDNVGAKYLNFLSIEADRVQRHYLASLEALRAIHSPRFELNIKTNTAVVGNNQAVQVKNV